MWYCSLTFSRRVFVSLAQKLSIEESEQVDVLSPPNGELSAAPLAGVKGGTGCERDERQQTAAIAPWIAGLFRVERSRWRNAGAYSHREIAEV